MARKSPGSPPTAFIPISRPSFGPEEVRAVARVLESGWVSDGPVVRQFEDAFARYLGMKHCIAVSSGTAALHLTLMALDIGPGDEVLVPDFTFPATGHAVFYVGAKPRLVDIDSRTLNIDCSLLRGQNRRNVRAVVPVHLAGNPADMDALREISREHDWVLIEDAAQALGAEFRGQKVGTFGRASCFSFHGRKLITTGEGGAIVTNDSSLAQRLRILRSHGMSSHAWKRFTSAQHAVPSFVELGYNFRISDIQAAVGLCQIEKLDRIIQRRKEIARIYRDELATLKGAVLPDEQARGTNVYFAFLLLLQPGISRSRVMADLQRDGIGTVLGSYALCVQGTFRHLRQRCPRSIRAFHRAMAIPLYGGMTDAQVRYVIERVRARIG